MFFFFFYVFRFLVSEEGVGQKRWMPKRWQKKKVAAEGVGQKRWQKRWLQKEWDRKCGCSRDRWEGKSRGLRRFSLGGFPWPRVSNGGGGRFF
uniref:Secreted protein n=1 Tax=Vitis vinifera TaxID=29760 RepID=F6I6R7_VITVI